MLAYDELQQLLHKLGVSQEASEYHGALCGMLCHGELRPQALIFDEMKSDPDARAQLMGFSQDSLEHLQLPEFMPLLPDDDAVLLERVESLAAWCGGFLYGLGIGEGVDIRKFSEESQELVRDFTEISRAGMDHGDEQPGEEEERAYAELVEYVRVGAQVIFLELYTPVHAAQGPEQLQGNHTLH